MDGENMKSKIKNFISLCLLVALFSIQPSYASESSDNPAAIEESDIKNGDEITITEVAPQETEETTNVIVEEKRPQKAANQKPQENKSEKPENKTRSIPKIDPKAAEVNERVNKKYKQNQEAEQKSQSKSKPMAKPKPSKKDTSAEKKELEDVEALIKELEASTNAIQKSLDSMNKSGAKKSKEVKSYEKTLDRVNDTIRSEKISKSESEKIARTTNKIVSEYDKKIKAAKTSQEKEALVKEASKKINDSLAATSKKLREDNDSIYNQKNEKLVLEIEADDKYGKEDDKNIKATKANSLEKSPKLAEKNSYKGFLKLIISILLFLIIALSASLAHVLRKHNNK